LRDDSPDAIVLIVYSAAGLNLLLALSLASMVLNWLRSGLEVREYGLLFGWVWFVPWSDVVDCKWSRRKRLRIQTRFRTQVSWLVREPSEAITEVIGRFVPVYDAKGALLAGPAEERRTAEAAPSGVSRRYLMQFDLKCLLLLTVAVACAASCYAVRCRRLKPHWDAVARHADAIARLKALGPQMKRIGDGVWGLDFSGCKNKPTDDDLAHLEPLAELASIDLCGAPVSDAGLMHLRQLKKLIWIDLMDTKVTDAGLAHLEGLEELIHVDRKRPAECVLRAVIG
jgi:hypothetical protein